MNKVEFNKKVEDTLNSLDALKIIEPNPFMFAKIMNGLNENTIRNKGSYFGKYAVGFAMLAVINLFVFFNYQKTEEVKESNTSQNTVSIKEFAKEYFSTSGEYNYYK
ncbi:hypothetical protein BH10BAC5_BH10BAC5_20190 [soil metagenome]